MDRVVGVLPAGGRARRIHGFFKEMMPIGIDESDKSKFVVSSEQIVRNIFVGGATAVHFILGAKKAFIAEYYAKQEIFTGRINFNYLTEDIEDLGMPFTIDSIYEQIRSYEYVLMGMPDTVIEPVEAFDITLKLLRRSNADLALGMFHTDTRNKGGFIEIDQDSKQVLKHVDKTSPNFPEHADNTWAIVAWNQLFTDYMHDLLKKKRSHFNLNKPVIQAEFLFGDVLDEAIKEPSIRVVADFVDKQRGFYWDITEPEKYFDLLRHYSPNEGLGGRS